MQSNPRLSANLLVILVKIPEVDKNPPRAPPYWTYIWPLGLAAPWIYTWPPTAVTISPSEGSGRLDTASAHGHAPPHLLTPGVAFQMLLMFPMIVVFMCSNNVFLFELRNFDCLKC